MHRTEGLVAAGIALVVADVALPRHGWGIPLVLAGLLAAALQVDAVRRYRPDRLAPWYFLTAAIVLSTVGFAIQSALGRPALYLPTASHVLIIGSTVCSVLSYATFVRAKSRVFDRYLLLDLSVFAISGLTAFKALVLDPLMAANPPVGMSKDLSSAYLLILIINIVLVVRFVALRGRRVTATWLLLTAVVVDLVGSLVVSATSAADGNAASIHLPIMLGCVICTLAARHPSMVQLTEPIEGEAPGFGPVRITGLGLALLGAPTTAVIVEAQTGELNPLSVLVPMALVTVLVLVRLRLVFAREEAAREHVAASEERFVALIQGISDVIAVVDVEGTINYVTGSAAKALGRSPDELLGHSLVDLLHDDDASGVTSVLQGMVGSGETVDLTAHVLVDGTERVFEIEVSDRTGNARLQGLIIVLHDVTHRHRLEGELRHQAMHDVLTGLPNRGLFTDRVAEALSGDRLASVLFIDLDDFKDVNDCLGHQAGDELLRAVAARLHHAVRDGDSVARLGGDEFAVLLVDADPMLSQRVADRALRLLAEPFEIAEHRLAIGASIGLASGRGLSVEDLLRRSDVAMYRAKAAGKGSVAVFEPGWEDVGTEQMSSRLDLARVISR